MKSSFLFCKMKSGLPFALKKGGPRAGSALFRIETDEGLQPYQSARRFPSSSRGDARVRKIDRRLQISDHLWVFEI